MNNFDLDLDQFWESMVKILDSKGITVGSGFIIHSDGYIITCHHVIYRLSSLKVEYCEQEYQAKWCEEYSDPEVDIAILKIEVKDAKPIPITVPKERAVSVMVYGFPYAQGKKGFSKGFDVYGTLSQSPPIQTRATYKNIAEVEQLKPWNKKPKEDSTFWAYRIDQKVDSGISGGPVIDRNSGYAIGLIQCRSTGSQESYVISWKNITESLTLLGIDLEQATNAFKFEVSHSSLGGKLVTFQGYFQVQGVENNRVNSFEIKRYIEENLKIEVINFINSSPLFKQKEQEDEWEREQRLEDIKQQKYLISILKRRAKILQETIINILPINPVQADSYRSQLEKCEADIQEKENKLRQLREKDNNADLFLLLNDSQNLSQIERFSDDWVKKAVSSQFGLEISISNLSIKPTDGDYS
ncbi:MAG: trypsin-like peptidase domain-containing protein [Xenococcus sp. MO_188.B8]|nr:trypsin-like peptidase domain-containing protein [Xenococcus sp. MO_188.B8]